MVSSTLPGAVAGAGAGGNSCTEGAGVAVIGLGTRGSVVVDRLVAQGVLPLVGLHKAEKRTTVVEPHTLITKLIPSQACIDVARHP